MKQGIRKFGFLVNQLGKLTPEEKKRLIEENRLKYGMSSEEVAAIKLPAPCHLLQVYNIDKIMNPRLKLTTIEKINHFIKLRDALQSKLDMLRQGTLVVHHGHSGTLGSMNRRGRPPANRVGGTPLKMMGGANYYAGLVKTTATVGGGATAGDGSDVDEEMEIGEEVIPEESAVVEEEEEEEGQEELADFEEAPDDDEGDEAPHKPTYCPIPDTTLSTIQAITTKSLTQLRVTTPEDGKSSLFASSFKK